MMPPESPFYWRYYIIGIFGKSSQLKPFPRHLNPFQVGKVKSSLILFCQAASSSGLFIPSDLLERQLITLVKDHDSELYKLFIIRNHVMVKVLESHRRDKKLCQDTYSCIPKYLAQRLKSEHSGTMFSETLAQLQHHAATLFDVPLII